MSAGGSMMLGGKELGRWSLFLVDRASILNLEDRLESDLKKYMREGINNKMIKKYDIIGFEKAEKKITKLITKFGGQPIGIKESQWPISEGWNNRKMMFVGQILLEKGMLGNKKDLMIYIFITHSDNYEDDFFDPDAIEWSGGENAVIIQPLEEVL